MIKWTKVGNTENQLNVLSKLIFFSTFELTDRSDKRHEKRCCFSLTLRDMNLFF